MWMMEKIGKSRVETFMSWFVKVHPHETSSLFYSTSTFFFVSSRSFPPPPLYISISLCLCFCFEIVVLIIF